MVRNMVNNKGFKEHLVKSFTSDVRYDLRKKLMFRDIKVEFGCLSKAEGSCKVSLGDTVVVAGTKLAIEPPYPDRPDEGSFSVNTELLPLSSPEFETGPPGIDAIEIARVTDRCLREGKAVNFKKLLIEKGEKAWTVFIDIASINDDGNLLDASALATLGALLNTRFPKVDKNGLIDYKSKTKKKLPIENLPILVTVYKIGNNLFLDPVKSEEHFIDARLSVGVLEDGTICALQKGGDATITLEELDRMLDIAIKQSKELRKIFKGGLSG